LAVGITDDVRQELASEDGFALQTAERLEDALGTAGSVDAVVLELVGARPLETLETLRAAAPRVAIIVVTGPENVADGTVALHAGAEDHLVLGAIPPGLLPRAVRYAAGIRRLRRELATQDEDTGLPNLRGFEPIAEHHLRMAARTNLPVVFLFVRIEGLSELGDPTEEATVAREAAAVVLDAIRDADVPARVGPDTFCVLLTGEAHGAEALVLSRLVEAIAAHNARLDRPRPLSIAVGSALHEPGGEGSASLQQILETADRRLAEQRANRSEPA
jgi:diguanylate cyclase (GGDEF)-like protein